MLTASHEINLKKNHYNPKITLQTGILKNSFWACLGALYKISIYYKTLNTFSISHKITSKTTHINSKIKLPISNTLSKYSKENMNTRVVYLYSLILLCDYMMIKGVIWDEWDHTKTNMVVVFMSFFAKTWSLKTSEMKLDRSFILETKIF